MQNNKIDTVVHLESVGGLDSHLARQGVGGMGWEGTRIRVDDVCKFMI